MNAADRRAEDDPDARRVEAVQAGVARTPRVRRASASSTLRSSFRASLGDAT